jgi:hypothetical protein
LLGHPHGLRDDSTFIPGLGEYPPVFNAALCTAKID